MSAYGVEALTVRYGNLTAVRNVSFEVPVGGSLAIVGHNGAGKSSTLLAIANCLPSEGEATGRLLVPDASAPVALASTRGRRDRAVVPEREKVFPLMSVQENLLAASRYRREDRIRIDDIYGYFPRLAERRQTLAGNLSGGEQQMLAIGSALLGTPRLVLVDEPTLGLAVPVIETICAKLLELRKQLGLTLIVAVAETAWIADLAESAVVLDAGELVGASAPTTGRGCEDVEARLAGIDDARRERDGRPLRA